MKIEGIGTISKEEAMKILTREGREAVKSGDITTEELGEMYKLEMVKILYYANDRQKSSGNLVIKDGFSGLSFSFLCVQIRPTSRTYSNHFKQGKMIE